MCSPCISVIIPVYNGEKYIIQALDSCLVQNDVVIEIIVVDDGSCDNTNKLVNSYIVKYDNIKYFRINNSGPSIARKVGLSRSCGEYVFFLDCDDLFYSCNSLFILLEAALSSKADVVIGQYVSQSSHVVSSFYRSTSTHDIDFLYQRLPFTLWPCMFNSKVLKMLEFPRNYFVGEDFVLNCMIYSNLRLNVRTVKEVVYSYNDLNVNSITRIKSGKKIRMHLLAYEEGISKFSNSVLPKNSIEAIYYNKLIFLYSLISNRTRLAVLFYHRNMNLLSKDLFSSFVSIEKLKIKIILALFFCMPKSIYKLLCR